MHRIYKGIEIAPVVEKLKADGKLGEDQLPPDPLRVFADESYLNQLDEVAQSAFHREPGLPPDTDRTDGSAA